MSACQMVMLAHWNDSIYRYISCIRPLHSSNQSLHHPKQVRPVKQVTLSVKSEVVGAQMIHSWSVQPPTGIYPLLYPYLTPSDLPLLITVYLHFKVKSLSSCSVLLHILFFSVIILKGSDTIYFTLCLKLTSGTVVSNEIWRPCYSNNGKKAIIF